MIKAAVESIMSIDLITITPKQSYDEVGCLFVTHKKYHLPLDNTAYHLFDTSTTCNLWKKKIYPNDCKHTVVEKIMTTDVIKGCHVLPVINRDDKLISKQASFDVMSNEFKKQCPKPIHFKYLFERNYQSTTRISA